MLLQATVGILGAAAIVMLSMAPAHADRAPTADELPQIENALRSLGFTAWDDIELDDDAWEIDDARGADGKEFDLRLRPDTFEVIEREEG
jgi:hypothetical protein